MAHEKQLRNMTDTINIKSITRAFKFLGMGKPKHPLISVFEHNSIQMPELDEEQRFLIDLYQVTLKDGITCKMGYGRNLYDFEEGTMVFTKPGQLVTASEVASTKEDKGWSLFFHPDLIRKSVLGKTINNYSYFDYELSEALHLSDEEIQTINETVGKIVKEYSQNIDKHSQILIISNLELLLNYCNRFYDRQFYTRTNLNKDFVSMFEHILIDYFEAELTIDNGVPTVKYCAEEMNMTPNYLGDLLKKETGRSAQEHIHNFVLDKAKNYLLSTTDSVSEIAYRLGFESPSYFGKLFKTKVGITPAQYRLTN